MDAQVTQPVPSSRKATWCICPRGFHESGLMPLLTTLAIMLSKRLGEDSSVGNPHGFGEAIRVVRKPREERSTGRKVAATLLHRMFESPAKMVVASAFTQLP